MGADADTHSQRLVVGRATLRKRGRVNFRSQLDRGEQGPQNKLSRPHINSETEVIITEISQE